MLAMLRIRRGTKVSASVMTAPYLTLNMPLTWKRKYWTAGIYIATTGNNFLGVRFKGLSHRVRYRLADHPMKSAEMTSLGWNMADG